MSGSLLDQDEWDEGYASTVLQLAAADDPLRLWLERHVPASPLPRLHCLELGCFPGRYLAVLARLGYEVHGIDLTPRVEHDLPPWLTASGYAVGSFARADVWTHEFGKQFDLVCSFGLIEHFENWRDLLIRHVELVKPGGMLVVTTPNFRAGLQGYLHRLLDAENLTKHDTSAMYPDRWRALLEDHGMTVESSGGIGKFEFWTAPQRLSRPRKAALRVVRYATPAIRFLSKAQSIYTAPYFGLVARKRVKGEK